MASVAVTNVNHNVSVDTSDGIVCWLWVKGQYTRLSSAQCTALATAMTSAASAVSATNTSPLVDWNA